MCISHLVPGTLYHSGRRAVLGAKAPPSNQAAVTVINSGSSKDHFIQRCLRQLWFSASVFDFELQARHIPGEHNVLADALSRWDSDPSPQDTFQMSARSLGRVYTFQQVPPDCLVFQIS